jgi:predicted GNAT superfamily acetyltransferase
MGSGKGSGAVSEGLRVRLLTDLSEFADCVELQETIWGYDASDRVPRKMFRVVERIGGLVLGVFDDSKTDGHKMIGFAMALPGYRDGAAYLHSHMLAVLPEYRNAGVGRRLKLAQREIALERGIDRMEWTFDPLEIKNAYLNIARLGAVVRRYERDFYGPSSSPLQGGLPTDRLVAEWWLRSPRVEALLAGKPLPMSELVAQVEVSAEVYRWKQNQAERPLALEMQTRNREALEKYFGQGLAVVGYALDDAKNGKFLLATPSTWAAGRCEGYDG